MNLKLFVCALLLGITTLAQEPASFVNPFIGTTNRGNTHPGAVLPWGMVSVSPHTTNVFRGAAYYEHGAPFIYGFGHTQLSGVGCNEAGNVVIMPVAADGPLFDSEIRKSPYTAEQATAGYYSCFLEKPKVKAEVTATQRTGRSLFHFSEAKGSLVLDLTLNKSIVKGGQLKIVSPVEIEGYQWGGKFCDMPLKRKVYFVMRVKAPNTTLQLFTDSSFTNDQTVSGDAIGCVATASATGPLTIEVSVGVSFVSIANARQNLEQEQRNASFAQLKEAAWQSWNKLLATIAVTGGSADDKTKFYTAYYHTLLSPVVFNDVNGEYLSMQTDTAQQRRVMAAKSDQYSVYSLWDTYRTVHPFLTLVHPKQQEDMVHSMLNMYRQGGWLPKWELYGQESWVMVGDPAPIVIADSYIKGLRNINTQLAWEAMKKGSLQTAPQNMLRPGNKDYWRYGYIPIDRRGGTDSTLFSWTNGYVWGAVSTALEYHIADYNIGVFAKAIGRQKESTRWLAQGNRFTTLFDPQTKMFRPRLASGAWKQPFDPKDREFDIRWKNSGGHGYVEGDAWNYRFFAPHNPSALIRLYGGPKAFTDTLQELFDDGHFDMTNEPDITYPYLFNYVKGEEWRTQKTVQQCIGQYFTNSPGGIPGNDDAGTMSAWLLFSMMGIFPDCPGKVDYQITTPAFDRVVLRLSKQYHQGANFVIEKRGTGSHIRNLYLNGKKLAGYSITHQQITNGGTLLIETSEGQHPTPVATE